MFSRDSIRKRHSLIFLKTADRNGFVIDR